MRWLLIALVFEDVGTPGTFQGGSPKRSRLGVGAGACVAVFHRVYFPKGSVDGSIAKISRFSTSSAH